MFILKYYEKKYYSFAEKYCSTEQGYGKIQVLAASSHALYIVTSARLSLPTARVPPGISIWLATSPQAHNSLSRHQWQCLSLSLAKVQDHPAKKKGARSQIHSDKRASIATCKLQRFVQTSKGTPINRHIPTNTSCQRDARPFRTGT
jgi:hypothetical protein